MDLHTVVSAAPTAVPVSILLTIMGWLWKMLAQSEKRNGEYIDRISDDYDNEIKTLRAELKEVRAQIARISAELDRERELRRNAEEEAHQARMRQYGTTD